MATDDREWNWRDTQGTEDGAEVIAAASVEDVVPPIVAPPRRRWTVRALTVPLTLLIAILVAWGLGAAVSRWRAQIAADHLSRANAEASRRAEAQAEQDRNEAAQREAQVQARLRQQEEARIAAINEKQRADDEARRAELDAADRKEKAWAKFYRKPPGCETAATMDCANAYIRAQRQFEQKWAKGEL